MSADSADLGAVRFFISRANMKDSDRGHEGPLEIAVAGDLTDNQADLCDKLLSVEPGGECILYFDSLGGSPYCGIALTTLITLRGLRATGIVAGECSSAALWPFAACRRRLVTPLSVLLFHGMKWQSEDNVAVIEAAEWARHFGQLEKDMDVYLAELFGGAAEKIAEWTRAGRYVSGPELAKAGLAELVELKPLAGNGKGARKSKI
jgi:ATP-dependent Clp protease, protease subunit